MEVVMLSLKRNSKGGFIDAPGVRKRNIYSSSSSKQFKLSRGKFSDFLTCPRCFYLDRVKGLISPSLPGWSLNSLTDDLLKKEFDYCRETQTPHRIISESGLTNIIPYSHPDIDKWRDSLHHGIQYRLPDSNILLTGGIDDIWIDLTTKELIIVDYKSQASSQPLTPYLYLSNYYHQGYKKQIDFYVYLFQMNGYKISRKSYFYVCNAIRTVDEFNGKMIFEEKLIPYEWDTSWIDEKLTEMINIISSNEMPDKNPSCENCAYSMKRSEMEGYTNVNPL
jgi:hypothetical protein